MIAGGGRADVDSRCDVRWVGYGVYRRLFQARMDSDTVWAPAQALVAIQFKKE
jgi:hypothetical protein